jgi:hypothetical protein
MFKKSKLLVCTLVLAMGLTGFAIPACAAEVAAAPTHSASAVHHSKCNHMHGGHTMGLLSEITGKSVSQITSQYPQQTAWQIAKSMGKLDNLKKAYLARAKVKIDSLIDNKKISANDGAKMYADLQKRVSAIDGVNIVIPGKPGFKAEMQPTH